VRPGTVDNILVETYPAAIRLAGIGHATTPSAGRFSIPFSVALALTKGTAGAGDYTEETVGDVAIQDLAQKVTLSVRGKWEKLYPEKRGATVTITDVNQKEWSAEVGLAKGEPENPATPEEIYEKFRENATMLIDPDDAEKIVEVVNRLEDLTVERLMEVI
jgi:2-methylcitrate dehydratase PrpD